MFPDQFYFVQSCLQLSTNLSDDTATLGCVLWCEALVHGKTESGLVLILYSREVSCRKISLSRTGARGDGAWAGACTTQVSLVPLNWISDVISEKPCASLTRHN